MFLGSPTIDRDGSKHDSCQEGSEVAKLHCGREGASSACAGSHIHVPLVSYSPLATWLTSFDQVKCSCWLCFYLASPYVSANLPPEGQNSITNFSAVQKNRLKNNNPPIRKIHSGFLEEERERKEKKQCQKDLIA